MIGRPEGGMNTKLHTVTDADGRPIGFIMTASLAGDYADAATLLGSFSKAEWLLADRGYDADWIRDAWTDKGVKPFSPAGGLAANRSSTTSAATNAATGSKSCSGG